MVRLVCEMSDDEGPNNDADMDRFTFTLNARQSKCSNGGSDKSLTGGGLTIYKYAGGEVKVQKGSIWQDENKAVEVTFDNEHCANLEMSISGYAREQDNGSSSADEEARSTYRVPANKLLGNHSFKLTTSDFRYRCEFKIEEVGDWKFGGK